MSIESKEIYPNAPLQLVAFEMRFPLTLKLASREAISQFQDGLQRELPLIELVVEGGVSLDLEQGSFRPLSPKPIFKLYTKNRRASATVSQVSVVVESSAYHRYKDFRALVERVLTVLDESARIGGMTRLGLRYINEIRIPTEILTPRDWAPFVDEKLLGPISIASHLPASELMVRLQFDFGGGRGMLLNAGTLTGEVVSSQGPLKVKPKPSTGPLFLIDIDSSQVFEELEEFSPSHAISICDGLRHPIRDLFEGSITERLRDQVFRQEPTNSLPPGGDSWESVKRK